MEAPPNAPLIISIPNEVLPYRNDIRRFVEAMVYKLSVHASKGRWENIPIETALRLLEGEVKELREAVQRGNMVEILLEAADVGNYGLIASAIAVERGK
jgi:NTP pyrophosphatase (non-canonical NTP hydrolase)